MLRSSPSSSTTISPITVSVYRLALEAGWGAEAVRRQADNDPMTERGEQAGSASMGSFESFSTQVEDDGTPARALDIAGQAVRDFNHRSHGRFRIGKPGWEYPSNAYSALGELTYLAGGLPQAFEQIMAALRDAHEQGFIEIDAGSRGRATRRVRSRRPASLSNTPGKRRSRCTAASATRRTRSAPLPTPARTSPTTEHPAMWRRNRERRLTLRVGDRDAVGR